MWCYCRAVAVRQQLFKSKVQSTAHQTIHFGLLPLISISANIELQVYSVTCCVPYLRKPSITRIKRTNMIINVDIITDQRNSHQVGTFIVPVLNQGGILFPGNRPICYFLVLLYISTSFRFNRHSLKFENSQSKQTFGTTVIVLQRNPLRISRYVK
jgi:hypothetical protein